MNGNICNDAFFNGLDLGQKYEKTYGFKWDAIPATYYEVIELDRYRDVMELIKAQKVYHIKGLWSTFEKQGFTRYKIEVVQKILIRRKILKVFPAAGKAKRTLGLILICTSDCTQNDIDDYLIEFDVQDELRYIKEKQRKKESMTKEEYKEKMKIPKEAAAELKEEEAAVLLEERQSRSCEHGWAGDESCLVCSDLKRIEIRLAKKKALEELICPHGIDMNSDFCDKCGGIRQ